MAVVEIAKIKVRRGQANVDGIPQLDGGEFGWAVDTRSLYIGNGTLEEGAPTTGNTRMLTEYDLPNIFYLTSSTYVYANGSIPERFTDPSGSAQTQQTVQGKLDTWMTLVDFGVSPGTPTYSNQGIQNAIDQLYLNSDKNLSSSRVTLRLPAGTYDVTATIYIPPNVSLVGDGKGKTILNVMSTNTTILQFCDSTSEIDSYVIFQPGSTNITSQGRPRDILLTGMTLKYDDSITDYANALPLLRADCVESAAIVDCAFSGSTATTTSSYAAIEIRGQGSITTDNLTLDRVDFNLLGRAIVSDYDVQQINISNSRFTNLYRGIAFNEASLIGNDIGPREVRVHNSQFQDIIHEAWLVNANNGVNTNHVSSQNTYRNVGNNLLGELSAVTPVIQFATSGNVSVDDYFSRHEVINSTSTDVVLQPTVQGNTYIRQQTSYNVNLITSVNPVSLIKLPALGTAQLTEVKYILRKPIAMTSREGTLLVSAGLNGTVGVTDNFSYQGVNDGNLLFSVTSNTVTNAITVFYTSADNDGTIEYQFNQLQ